MAKEPTAQKAVRLVAEGRVHMTALGPDTCAAVVAGDTLNQFGERPRYETSLRGRWECSCPHGSMSRALCSHAQAVQLIYRAVRPALGG